MMAWMLTNCPSLVSPSDPAVLPGTWDVMGSASLAFEDPNHSLYGIEIKGGK
jgi:hypothetical protein